MFPLIFGTQVVGGALLLLGQWGQLAVLILAPVVVNIVAFHIFLDPAGIAPGAVVAVLEAFLAWHYREAYRSIFGGAIQR